MDNIVEINAIVKGVVAWRKEVGDNFVQLNIGIIDQGRIKELEDTAARVVYIIKSRKLRRVGFKRVPIGPRTKQTRGRFFDRSRRAIVSYTKWER